MYVFTGTSHIKEHLAFADILCRKLWWYSYEQEATDEMCKPLQHVNDEFLFTAGQLITTQETIVISMVPLKPFWVLDFYSLELSRLKSCFQNDFSPRTNPLAQLAVKQYRLRNRSNRQTALFMQYFPDPEAWPSYRTSVKVYPFLSQEQSVTRQVSNPDRGGTGVATTVAHQNYSPFYPAQAIFKIRNDGIEEPDDNPLYQ